jgi:hypothetical protein
MPILIILEGLRQLLTGVTRPPLLLFTLKIIRYGGLKEVQHFLVTKSTPDPNRWSSCTMVNNYT